MKGTFFLLFLFITFNTYSQEIKISGIIKDNQNRSIQNASVSLLDDNNENLGYNFTDENGKYNISFKQTKTDKITFVIEKYEEGTLVKVLKYFEKKEYNGKIEVIEIAELENTKMREIITKNNWDYSVYTKAAEVPGEYKTKEGTFTKADAVNDFLFNLKKQLK